MSFIKIDDIPSNLLEIILLDISLNDMCNFKCTSKKNQQIINSVLEKKLKSYTDFYLSYINDNCSDFIKDLIKKEFLHRHPGLIQMNDEIINEAVSLFKENPIDCEIKFGPVELWDISRVTDKNQFFIEMKDVNRCLLY